MKKRTVPGFRDRKAKRTAEYGMMISLAFLLSYVETMIPVNLGIQGVKLGLANLVAIVGLYVIGVKGTVVISLARIVLVGLTFGNLYSMIYGMAGGLLSLGLMIVSRKTGWFGQIGVSIIGGVGHNVGQLAIAALVLEDGRIFYYLPVLLCAGSVAGALIGVLGGMITERISGHVKRE